MSNLAGRLGKLEQAQRQRNPSALWRELLAARFADAVYASHRGALVDALCSENPLYTFQAQDDEEAPTSTARYVVSWWGRAQGLPPCVRVYVLAPLE